MALRTWCTFRWALDTTEEAKPRTADRCRAGEGGPMDCHSCPTVRWAPATGAASTRRDRAAAAARWDRPPCTMPRRPPGERGVPTPGLPSRRAGVAGGALGAPSATWRPGTPGGAAGSWRVLRPSTAPLLPAPLPLLLLPSPSTSTSTSSSSPTTAAATSSSSSSSSSSTPSTSSSSSSPPPVPGSPGGGGSQ